MHGKHCLITGATSGIGKATALALARLGADVILVGRNEAAGAALVRRINDSAWGATGSFIRTDLSVQKEVRALAAEIGGRWDHVDVMINNAGAKFDRYQESSDGIELTFATNHLGHFLLTALILERLVSAPAARVITISSGTHQSVRSPVTWCPGRDAYDRKAAYARSKLANLVFSHELARRLGSTSVTSNAVDPGGVATRLGLNNGLLSWLRHIGFYLLKRQLISSRRGAETVVFLASSPGVQGISGRYFHWSREVGSSPLSQDRRLAADLWRLSVEFTGLSEALGPAWEWVHP